MQSLSHLTPRANSRAVLGRQTPQGKLWQPWPCPPKLESLCREKRCCSRYWRSTGWKRMKENYSSFEVHTHLTANLSDPRRGRYLLCFQSLQRGWAVSGKCKHLGTQKQGIPLFSLTCPVILWIRGECLCATVTCLNKMGKCPTEVASHGKQTRSGEGKNGRGPSPLPRSRARNRQQRGREYTQKETWTGTECLCKSQAVLWSYCLTKNRKSKKKKSHPRGM